MATFQNKRFGVHDPWMTPFSAWNNVAKYIPKDKTIWEPFVGDGASQHYLEELGFNVKCDYGDFFKSPLMNENNIVVTNPPFSLYVEVLTELKKNNKPFMMILPSSKMNTSVMRNLFKNEIQIIVPRKRIQFKKLVNGKIDESAGGKCAFDCFYYCYKWNLPKDIIYLEDEDILKPNFEPIPVEQGKHYSYLRINKHLINLQNNLLIMDMKRQLLEMEIPRIRDISFNFNL